MRQGIHWYRLYNRSTGMWSGGVRVSVGWPILEIFYKRNKVISADLSELVIYIDDCGHRTHPTTAIIRRFLGLLEMNYRVRLVNMDTGSDTNEPGLRRRKQKIICIKNKSKNISTALHGGKAVIGMTPRAVQLLYKLKHAEISMI